MRRAYSTTSALAALLLVTAGSGGGVVYVCIGADGHVGLKSAPGACEGCCRGHVTRDSCDSHGSCGSPEGGSHAEKAAGIRGAPHECDCVDIAVRVERSSPATAKLKTRQSPSASPSAPARSARVRTADVPPGRPAPSAHASVSDLRTVVLIV